MRLSGFLSASSRRSCVVLGVATLLGVASEVSAAQAAAGGQAPAGGAAPAAGQAPAAAPAPDPFKFTSDAMVVFWNVNADKTTDFESVWNTIRGKLVASDKPDLKEMGTNLKIYKLPMAAGATTVSYFMFSDPASKTTYQPSPFLLYESGLFPVRADGQALFDKLAGSLAAQNPINPLPLTRVAAQ